MALGRRDGQRANDLPRPAGRRRRGGAHPFIWVSLRDPAPRSWQPSSASSAYHRCWSTAWPRRHNDRCWNSPASCCSRWSRRPPGQPPKRPSGSGRYSWCSATASWSASTATGSCWSASARTWSTTLSWPGPGQRRCCPASSTTPPKATAPSSARSTTPSRRSRRRSSPRPGPADRAHLPALPPGAGVPASRGPTHRDARPPRHRVANRRRRAAPAPLSPARAHLLHHLPGAVPRVPAQRLAVASRRPL